MHSHFILGILNFESATGISRNMLLHFLMFVIFLRITTLYRINVMVLVLQRLLMNVGFLLETNRIKNLEHASIDRIITTPI